MHTFARLLASIALLAPPAALALDSAKTPPITAKSVTTNRLVIEGSGSTGDASGMSATTIGATTARALSSKLRDPGVSVLDYGPSVGTGGDDSAAINAALRSACDFSQANPAAKTCRIIFPEPPSGAYNVCANPVTLPGYSASVFLEGRGAAPTIRTQPGCANPPLAPLYQSQFVGDSSKARVHIDNLTFDAYGLSKYSAYFGYIVGMNSTRSIYRNAAKDGANVYIGGGYEIRMDSSNRMENVNERGRVVYATRADLPKYNLYTRSSDSWFGLAAINANFANYYSAIGGNNHYADAHGWGFHTAVAPYSTGNFAPLYTFVTNGNSDFVNSVADSPQACGYVFRSQQQARFTGSISGGVLTVTATDNNIPILNGYTVTGDDIPPGTQVVSLGSGTGGVGTYNLNNATISLASRSMGAGVQSGAYLSGSMVQGPASFTVTGSIAGSIFTPASVPSGSVLGVGQTLTYGANKATILADNGNGTYQLVGSPVAAAAGTSMSVAACAALLDQGLQQGLVRSNNFLATKDTITSLDGSIHPSFSYGNNTDYYTQWGDSPFRSRSPGGDTLTGTGSATPGGTSTLAATSATGAATLSLASQGTGRVQLSANGVPVFAAYGASSSVNYLTAFGASASGTPLLSATGADTNIWINYATKGAGLHQFLSQDAVQFQVGSTASAVNNARASGAAAGGIPSIAAVGADTNVAMAIVGKGTSGVLTGAFIRTADPTTTDIPNGQCADWNNTTAGTFKRVCNFAGTLRSATLN